MSREEREAELAALKDAKAKRTTMFTADGKLISQFSPKNDDATRQKAKEAADLAKIPQKKKIKSSMFTSDGKLISQTPGWTASPSKPETSPKTDTVTKPPTVAEEPTKTESPKPLVESNNTPPNSLASSIVYEVTSIKEPTPTIEPVIEPATVEPVTTTTEETMVATMFESMILSPVSVNPAETKGKPAVVTPKVESAMPKATLPVRPVEKPNKAFSVPALTIQNSADEFDDILDGAAMSGGEDELLGWSLDASSGNMTDWKIVVHNLADNSEVTYHVHRLVLSTGPTKSEYFENIIRSESENCTTEVALSVSAALAYPQFLDFLYSREDKVAVTTANAAALRFLGKYFGVRKLVVLVTTFVRDDLKPNTSLHYLNAAAEFQDEKLMTTAAQICAQNIATTAVDREGLTSLDPPLFSMVVSFPNVACSSEELSKYVAEFARKHDSEMNVSLLGVVTDNKNMPTIDPCEAVYLLQLSERHGDKSDLAARCIKSCATAWHGTLVANHVESAPYDIGPYAAISAPLKVQLLEKALLQAHADSNDVVTSMDDARMAEKQRLASIEEAVTERDKTIDLMKSVQIEQDGKYAKLEAELAKFARVPCEHEFAKKKECTFHKDATGSKKSPYGKKKPTAMPLGSTSSDQEGYLYENGNHLLPVYYYQGN